MDRHRPYFLIVAFGLGLAACGQDLPVEFTVDDRFDNRHAEIIRQAAADWNRVTEEWLGFPALIDRGRFTDPDFYPYDDLNRGLDEPKRVYRGRQDRWLDLLTGTDAKEDDGGTYEIIAYNTETAIIVWPEVCASLGDEAEDCLLTAIRHEFGHALGLAHLPESMPGLMSAYAVPGEWPSIGLNDIRALCVVHDCQKDPPP